MLDMFNSLRETLTSEPDFSCYYNHMFIIIFIAFISSRFDSDYFVNGLPLGFFYLNLRALHWRMEDLKLSTVLLCNDFAKSG